jgi:hypothetical protein
MMRGLILAIGTCALAVAGQADTLAYRCTMTGATARDWIQPLIFILHDTESGRVVASDPLILAFNDGHPVEGRLLVDNAARITFAWDVEVVLRVSPVRLLYRATFLKASGQLSVSVSARGRDGQMNGLGTCVVAPLG